jgi:hypothetical protein
MTNLIVISAIQWNHFMFVGDLVGDNNNSIANCIFYLIKRSNQPEDGSWLEPKQCKKYTLIKSLIELCLAIYFLYIVYIYSGKTR